MNAPAASTIFSAIQPTGSLHLGNYLGALKNFVALQDSKAYDCIFCIADLHALTQWSDFDQLAQHTRSTAAAFLACGIDPNKHILFHQSRAAAHAELAWIFICAARFGWLNRMTQFKEKTGKHRDESSAGLFAYPALMAADILAYRATHVPIGEDQKQHLELARDIAQKFNHDLKQDFFPLPEPIIPNISARVMSLRDGTKKMSKSDPSDMTRINLTDDADLIAKKIQRAKTDSHLLPEKESALAQRPEADNLIGLIAALTDMPKQQALDRFSGKNFAALKQELTECLVETICPIGKKIRLYHQDHAELDRLLAQGARRAAEKARPHIAQIRNLLGLL